MLFGLILETEPNQFRFLFCLLDSPKLKQSGSLFGPGQVFEWNFKYARKKSRSIRKQFSLNRSFLVSTIFQPGVTPKVFDRYQENEIGQKRKQSF
jgi:hypothetical protein